jgi:hypothetical protein
LYTDVIYKWLETSLDYGIEEAKFWDMTIAEIERAVASKNRVRELEQKEKALFDYIHAELVGRSMARVFNSNNEYPAIEEAYPTIFENVAAIQEKQAKKAELSALRFKLFADKYNSKFKEVAQEE